MTGDDESLCLFAPKLFLVPDPRGLPLLLVELEAEEEDSDKDLLSESEPAAGSGEGDLLRPRNS